MEWECPIGSLLSYTQDRRPWIMDSTLWILDSRCWIPVFFSGTYVLDSNHLMELTEGKNHKTCALELSRLFLVFPTFDYQNGGGLIGIQHVTADAAKPLSSLWEFFNIVKRNLSAFSHVLATLAKRSDLNRFSKATMFVTSLGAYFEACYFEEGQVSCVSQGGCLLFKVRKEKFWRWIVYVKHIKYDFFSFLWKFFRAL